MRPWKALPRIAQLEIYIDPVILGTLYPFHLVSDFGTKFILEPKMAFMNETRQKGLQNQGIDLSEAKALRPKACSNFPAPLVPSLQQDENKRLSTTTIEWISSH